MDFLAAGAGLLILLAAGDLLVRGAVALSLRLGIPALLVSLTIVAFGTSAPELLIALQAVFEDAPGIAFGNVVGSNIANVFLVLGVPALISRIDACGSDTWMSYGQMMVATVVFIVLLLVGPLGPIQGLILLGLLVVMLGHAFLQARAAREETFDDFDPEEAKNTGTGRALLFLAGGILGLPLGADILVDAAQDIAKDFGVSDEVIGLTLIAIGTSLPELATTTMAAIRRQVDVIIGNVIGSNMFNILAIMGVTAMFGPLWAPEDLLEQDIWVMLAAALALAPFVLFGRALGRRIGIGFLGVYTVYIVALF